MYLNTCMIDTTHSRKPIQKDRCIINITPNNASVNEVKKPNNIII